MDLGFGVLAFLAQNELCDETIEVVLELGSFVGTVDDPAVVCWIAVGLGTQLKPEVFDDI
jgi:hypothetical protein